MDFLALDQSFSVIKKAAFSTLTVLFAFAVAYVLILFYLGYSYEFHVVSTIAFTLLGVLITLGLFRGGSEGSSSMKVLLAGLVGAVLAEELLLNSVFAAYGLAISILGLVLLPVLAVKIGSNNGWLRVALEAVALVFATRVVLSPFPLGFLNLPFSSPPSIH